MTNKFRIFIASLVLGLSVFSFASAQSQGLVTCNRNDNLPANPTVEQRKDNQCKLTDLIYLIERIINFLLAWAWLISIFYVMWAGYNMLGSGGNAEAITSAKTTFSHAIIGFFLIMAAYLLINWVVSLLTGDSTPREGAFEIIRNLILRP
jgi:hypothetical protein